MGKNTERKDTKRNETRRWMNERERIKTEHV
jgi:hypothetical protein